MVGQDVEAVFGQDVKGEVMVGPVGEVVVAPSLRLDRETRLNSLGGGIQWVPAANL